MKKLMALLVSFIVSVNMVGCFSSGSGSSAPATVSVYCADVHNAGQIDACAAGTATGVDNVAGVSIVDAGVVSRGTMIEASLLATNNTATQWQGYWSMTFDAGCNGAATWPIVTLQQTPVLDIGQSWNPTVGGQCSDMPLGTHTLTATLYENDGVTPVVDGNNPVIVQFELTQ